MIDNTQLIKPGTPIDPMQLAESVFPTYGHEFKSCVILAVNNKEAVDVFFSSMQFRDLLFMREVLNNKISHILNGGPW